jgi:hypothetical protein
VKQLLRKDNEPKERIRILEQAADPRREATARAASMELASLGADGVKVLLRIVESDDVGASQHAAAALGVAGVAAEPAISVLEKAMESWTIPEGRRAARDALDAIRKALAAAK